MGFAIVTGGAGFLGRHVVARLLAEGKDVAVIDDASTPGAVFPDGVHRIGLDMTAHDTLKYGWTGDDEIWHLASPASPPAYKARRLTTLRLGGHVLDGVLRRAHESKARVLFASSSEVYGDPERHPQTEDLPSRINPVGERSCYDAAKVYGEALCAAWHHEEGVDVRIARIFNTFGPGQIAADGRLVPALIGAAVAGRPFTIHGDGMQTRTLGYVDDVVDGLFRIMRSGQPATPYNVGGDTEITVLGLVQLVSHMVKPVTIAFGPRQDADDPVRRRADTTRLRALGWSPRVSLPDGITRTAEWMAANSAA